MSDGIEKKYVYKVQATPEFGSVMLMEFSLPLNKGDVVDVASWLRESLHLEEKEIRIRISGSADLRSFQRKGLLKPVKPETPVIHTADLKNQGPKIPGIDLDFVPAKKPKVMEQVTLSKRPMEDPIRTDSKKIEKIGNSAEIHDLSYLKERSDKGIQKFPEDQLKKKTLEELNSIIRSLNGDASDNRTYFDEGQGKVVSRRIPKKDKIKKILEIQAG